jgi:hypothetical protein
MGVCDVALQIIELAIIFYMARLGFSTAKEAIKDSQLDYENTVAKKKPRGVLQIISVAVIRTQITPIVITRFQTITVIFPTSPTVHLPKK